MADVNIRIRDNGPFIVEGPITLTDAEGKQFTIDPNRPSIALCRCAASEHKPFCDGAHNRCGFQAAERADD